MACSKFDDLVTHVGHAVKVVTYGNPPVNVAVECVQCGVALMDFCRLLECEACGEDLDPEDDVCCECGEPTRRKR